MSEVEIRKLQPRGNTWSGGDEITSDALNNIERDLDNIIFILTSSAYEVPNNSPNIISALQEAQSKITSIRESLGTTSFDGQDISTAIAQIQNTINSLNIPNIDNLATNASVEALEDRLDKIDGGTILSVDSTLATLVATLKDRFDTFDSNNYVTTNSLNTVINNNEAIKEIQSAHRTGADLVNPANNYVDTLDARFDAIEAVLRSRNNNSNGANLNDRFIALEAAIETITGSDVDSGSLTALAARIAVLENALRSALDNDEDNVWETLEDYLSDLEQDVANLKTEVGQFDSSRIDTLETAISHTKDDSEENDKGGLTQRIDALEASIGDNEGNSLSGRVAALEGIDADNRLDSLEGIIGANATSGLQGTVATIQDSLDTINGKIGTGFTDVNTVTAAINNINTSINNISTTIIKSKSEVNYTDETPSNTQSWNIEDKNDYLLQGADDKYYYWKHVNGNWHLISGAGSTSNKPPVIAEELPNIEDADTTVDYFIGNESQNYIHYRYIENNSEKIPVIISNYTDHDSIKTYNITRVDTTRKVKDEDGNDTDEDENVSYLNLYEFDYGVDNSAIDDQSSHIRLRAQIELPQGAGGGTTTSSITRLYRFGDERLERISGSTIKLQIYYSSYDSEGVQSQSGSYTLKRNGVVIDSTELSDNILPSGAFKESINGWKSDTVGYYEFDLSQYCQIGDNTFTITVDPGDGSLPPSRSLYVNIKDLRLTTTAPQTLLVNVNESYAFPYTAYGAMDKVLHIIIDDNITRTVSLSSITSGREQTYVFSNLSHGLHSIKMYLTATIGGFEQSTENNSIIREYIWYDADNPTSETILASPRHGEQISALQYETIEIPYQVYKNGGGSTTVKYYIDYVDENSKPFEQVVLDNIASATLSYIADKVGEHTITIAVDSTSLSFDLVIAANTGVNISPIEDAIIDFDPTSLSNSSVNRLPTWTSNAGTFKMTASENFNWSDDISGGGYKQDEDGKCFVIKAGSYVDIDYPMFAGTAENNIFTNGGELKIIFKTKAVRNVKAVWYSNVGVYGDKQIGIQLEAHEGWLKTDKASQTNASGTNSTEYEAWESEHNYNVDDVVIYKEIIYKCLTTFDSNSTIEIDDKTVPVNTVNPKDASDYWLAMGKIDTQVLATDSYLYFPYSEEDKIELDININKYAKSANSNFIMSYEDGVPSKAYAYNYGTSGDQLTHNNTIHIGSPDCDVYIYHLRIYNKSLETSQILQNFIADGKTINEKKARYEKNSIYWDSQQKRYFTSPSATAILDPIKLAEKMPDVKILMLDTPVFTTGKKNFIPGSTLRCIQASGGKTAYASRGDADNWFFQNGLHSGQGTTSDNYGQSARNVDFLFICDGKHWPSKEKNVKKTFKLSENGDYHSSVAIGESASVWNEVTQTWEATEIDPETGICDDWKGDNCKITLTATSIPNNYFNLKENVASSENVNNALFQKRYNEFLLYNSPAKQRDSRIKNSMEFVPAVLFIRENAADEQGNPVGHTEFNDCNWHFYGLGNLGDSKKTDYTRAYDPEDMNEFTVENSDNNTNNGQFQSGVFEYNGHRAIETEFNIWSETVAYSKDAIIIYDGKIYKRIGANQAALGENETYEWVPEDWSNITPNTSENLYYAPRYNPNPMDYLYPISYDEWNVQLSGEYLNRKHATLVNEGFDGDHSFEFRYACRGDYRDGDLVNDTSDPTGEVDAEGNAITEDTVQFDLNHNVVLAFYEWLLTATESQYRAEASEWMVKSAMEFFYAYTHYYTMMDNRAKNTFWHFAKTGTYTLVSRPVKELMHVYTELKNNEYVPTQDTVPMAAYYVDNYILTTDKTFRANINYYTKNGSTYTLAEVTIDGEIPDNTYYIHTYKRTTEATFQENVQYYLLNKNNIYVATDVTVGSTIKYYYTQYAFDLWAYDMDTALGIDNNGAQVFPYGKEDDDYRVKNTPSSGYAFNGAGSIFWRRLKTTFADEIREIMNSTDINCFDSENLINEFDEFQNCFPEEIWRLDIERKYIRTFTGASVDNSITTGKQNSRFLTSMMQGRKKYQRRQWIRNQGVYFNSKYRLTDITRNENTIEFNIITPSNKENLAVTPDYHLQLTPYQDMYLNVQVGNGNYQDQIRAEAGQTYVMDLAKNTSGTFQETRIYINGFNSISGIGNLAPMYPYSFTLSALNHLKTLDIGTEETGYVNANLTSLPLTENSYLPLLETLNIKNCSNLSGTLGLSTANNLREIEATGSSIAGVILPDYTNIEILHLPTTTTAVELYGARMLHDFKISNITGNENYNSLLTLHVYDSDYSARYKENIDDPLPVDWLNIAKAMLQKQSPQTNIQLLKLSSATVENIDSLEPIVTAKSIIENGVDKIILSGNINIDDYWNSVQGLQYVNNIDVYTYNEDTDEYEYDSEASISDNQNNGIWPELTLNVKSDKGQIKHRVRYKNGSTLLYEYYAGDNSEFIDPAYDYGEGATLKTFPTKAADQQYIYTFGTYDGENNYEEYSGWIEENTNIKPSSSTKITKDTVYLADFPTRTLQRYTINWRSRSHTGNIGNSVTRDYGSDITDVISPERRYKEGTVQLNTTIAPTSTDGHAYVFKGWDQYLSVLKSNITLNAQWEQSTLDFNIINAQWDPNTLSFNNFTPITDFSSLNAADLYGISLISNDNQRTSLLQNYNGNGTINITMGNDLNYENITSNLLENKTLPYKIEYKNSSYNSIITDKKPFSNLDDAFTFVIDFKLLADSSYTGTERILASCYYNQNNSTIHGFKITYQKNTNTIYVYWGDQSVAIDSTLSTGTGYRDIVVIRHKTGSNMLGVYYHAPDLQQGDILPGGTVSTTLTHTYSKVTLSDIPIIIGGNYTADTTNIEVTNNRKPAYSEIYYCKYYDVALSNEDCKTLCSWTHETIPFILSGYSNNYSAFTSGTTLTVGDDNTKMNFTALSLIGDRGYTSNYNMTATEDGVQVAGWAYSDIREYCNNVIFYAMPITFQSIILNNIISTQKWRSVTSNGQIQWPANNVTLITVQDYIYIPCYNELLQTTNEYYNQESIGRWSQLGINVTCYSESGETIVRNDSNMLSTYAQRMLRTRYYGNNNNWTGVLYIVSQDPATHRYSYNNNDLIPQLGDCWWNESSGVMKIYSADGWIEASPWRTRTLSTDYSSTSTINQMYKVSVNGSVLKANYSDNLIPCGLNIEFSV